jgi:sugar lactone lactonase YvrE
MLSNLEGLGSEASVGIALLTRSLQKGGGVASDAVACTIHQTVLGEGIRWDARRSEVLAVDILVGQVYRGRVADDGDLIPSATYNVPGTVGAIVPVGGDEGWVLASGLGFVYLTPDGVLRRIVEVAPVGTRMNDGACDPQGRLWAGTVADDLRPGGGSMYRLDPDGSVRLVLDDLTISNGLGWSPDGATMYLVDSGPRLVHSFNFDQLTGGISDDHVFVEVAEEIGTPDGLTVDAAGDIWVAIYGGGRVRRYSPEGVLREELHVPTAQCTSCAFAGPGLTTLYVTTATEGWSDEQRRAQPAAGLVYRFDTDATGRPAALFRPEPTWWTQMTSGL